MKKFLFWAGIIIVVSGAGFFWSNRSFLSYSSKAVYYPAPRATFWAFQSVDTMKYSRDLAREKANDKSFDAIIARQIQAIAATGATHIGIATPYDEEFIPFLRRWVSAARTEGLKVWFRGNFSGWEQWFGYSHMRPDQHVVATRDFILKHPDLFEDGDVFSSCPECENGGPGDPRQTGAVKVYRNFLIADYQAAQGAFAEINRDVRANFFSMNGDVARLVMDDATTKALGGTITIDHYVKTPEQVIKDAKDYSKGGKYRIVLGEFGAPIPDIHGKMTDAEQAVWIGDLLGRAMREPSIDGVNYWLSVGGSTELWTSDGKARAGAETLRAYYDPYLVFGVVRDELGQPIQGARVKVGEWQAETTQDGYFELRYPSNVSDQIMIEAKGYSTIAIAPTEDVASTTQNITLAPIDASWKYRTLLRIRMILGR